MNALQSNFSKGFEFPHLVGRPFTHSQLFNCTQSFLWYQYITVHDLQTVRLVCVFHVQVLLFLKGKMTPSFFFLMLHWVGPFLFAILVVSWGDRWHGFIPERTVSATQLKISSNVCTLITCSCIVQEEYSHVVGRRSRGVRWVKQLRPIWPELNNFNKVWLSFFWAVGGVVRCQIDFMMSTSF